MYPHFIEVHDIEDGYPILMNIDSIANAITVKYECGTGTAINCRDCGGQVTKESYDEVKQLIESSGALINKGDPRIDSQHRLTMNVIMQMLGEPVWHSNLGSWALVHYYDPDRDQIQLLNSAGKIYVMDEEELIRYPLYRMIGGER